SAPSSTSRSTRWLPMNPPAPVTTTPRPLHCSGCRGKVLLDRVQEDLRKRLLRKRPVALRAHERACVLPILLDLHRPERAQILLQCIVGRKPARVDEALGRDVVRHIGRAAEDRDSPDKEGVEDLLVDPAREL